ncbi:MAG: hypothetical protein KAV83_04255 [Desulfobacterales bacterium]|nr:hypothetical protein [Desulfobacterales bacterium]
MKETIFFKFMIAVVFLSFSGCAVGNRHTYHNASIDFNNEGTFKIAVTTHDQRSYVVTGKKNPDFVGLQRGGFGNPFDITTASGKSLAEDITNTIARSLKAKGYDAIPVIVSHSDIDDSVRAALKNKNVHRSLLLTLNEWKSDTYNNTALKYDANLEVLDKNGKTIAEKRISGEDDLKGSFLNPPAHAKKVIPIAFKEKLEILLNSKQISDALK